MLGRTFWGQVGGMYVAVEGAPLGCPLSTAFQWISKSGFINDTFTCPFTWLFLHKLSRILEHRPLLLTPPAPPLSFLLSPVYLPAQWLLRQGRPLMSSLPSLLTQVRLRLPVRWLPSFSFWRIIFLYHLLPPEQTMTFLGGGGGGEERRWVWSERALGQFEFLVLVLVTYFSKQQSLWGCCIMSCSRETRSRIWGLEHFLLSLTSPGSSVMVTDSDWWPFNIASSQKLFQFLHHSAHAQLFWTGFHFWKLIKCSCLHE